MTPQELKEVVGQVVQAIMPEVIKAGKKQSPVADDLMTEVKKAHSKFCKAVEEGDVEEAKKAHQLYSQALKAAGLAEDQVTPEEQKAEEAKKASEAMVQKIASLEALVNKMAGVPQTPKSQAGVDAPAEAVDGLAITKPETVTKVKELLKAGFGPLDELLDARSRKTEENKRELAFVQLTRQIYGGETTSPEVMKIARQELVS